MRNFLILAFMLFSVGLAKAQYLSGPNGKWEYDGRYIKNYNNSSNKWEWDGRYLKNYNNSSNKWEWDGRYLKNYNNSSQKYELPSGAPVPVWAVVYGIIN
jgi:hypothetical protein